MILDSFSLKGKVAWITGASYGIGFAIATAFHEAGAKIVFNDINQELVDRGLASYKEIGIDAKGYVCDVTNEEQVTALAARIKEEVGVIDILVNNAGITRDSLMLRMKEEDWDAVMDTNLKSAFNTVKALQRVLMKSPAGRIINMSSVIGLVGNIGQANYAASKAGLIGFTKSLALEFAPRKVTCNAIAPGFISTEMSNAIPDNLKEEIVKKIPLKEQGSVEDIAALTAFLASDDARYITGQVIACDGGMTM